jgi:putative phosphoesterase
MIIGVISDTHGLLRPEALRALAGADRIIHAGDVGAPEVLEALARIAPLTAVRGNNDYEPWADVLPLTAVLEAGAALIYVLHDRNELDLDPTAAGFRVVVAGHSHQPGQERKGGVLYFNPGSAGPRRFRLPISVGRLVVDGDDVRGEIETLG